MDSLGSADASSGAAAGPLAPVYAELTTPEQLQEWYQVFHAYDRDGGGDVSTTELGLMLRAVGDRVTATRLDELVAMTDLNGSGACDFEEFAGLMLRRQRETEHRAYALGDDAAAPHTTRVFKLLSAAIAGQEELWLWSHAPGRETSRLGAAAEVIAQQRWWLLGIVDHLWTSQVRILSLPSCLGCDRLWVEEMCRVLAWARRSALEWLDLCGCNIGDDGMAQLAVALRTNTSLHTLKLARTGGGPVGGATMLDCLRHHNATLRALALDGNPLLPPPLQAEVAAQLRDNKVRAALSKAAGGTALTLRGLSLQPQHAPLLRALLSARPPPVRVPKPSACRHEARPVAPSYPRCMWWA